MAYRLKAALTACLLTVASVSMVVSTTGADAQSDDGFSKLDWQIAAAKSEDDSLKSAVGVVDGIISSPSFWRDLRIIADRHARIFIGQDYHQAGMPQGMADPAGMIAFLKARNEGRHTFAAVVTLTGTYYAKGDDYAGTCANLSGATIGCRGTQFGQNYSNQLVATHGIGLTPVGQREMVSIDVGREIFARYASTSPVRKSCTFNTLAHEWTHTIGKDQPSHWAIPIDIDTTKPAGVPYLSYLVGTAAQCSWLRSNKHIAGDDAALLACAAKFGVENFQSSQCI